MNRPLIRPLAVIWSLYGFNYPKAILGLTRRARNRGWRFLWAYWQTQNFQTIDSQQVARLPVWLLRFGMLAGYLEGAYLLYAGAAYHTTGAYAIGGAIILVTPVIWAHVSAFYLMVWNLLARPKQIGRDIVCFKLESQVKQLRKHHEFKIIVVAGSLGKTGTKSAIAQTLQATLRVQFQKGNYNDRVTVPLVLFGETEPELLDIMAWFRLFRRTSQQIRGAYPFDVAVLELGSDGPGQLADFTYLHPDLAVVTAVSDEHMEYFKTLDAVAAEELTVTSFSSQVLVNIDDIDSKYLAGKTYLSYGTEEGDYRIESIQNQSLTGQTVKYALGSHSIEPRIKLIGIQGAKTALAAAAVATIFDLDPLTIRSALRAIEPFSGRMQILKGINDTTIIDDTYNASALSMLSALDVLYETHAPQRIAILGSMNELGATSPSAHRTVGAACDPKKLEYVLTVGRDAKRYLAPAAKKNGCTVISYTSPYKAGGYARAHVRPGAVILAKGSQNGVFTEEAIKNLLADPADVGKLVRQSPSWLGAKQRQFPH